MAELIINKNDIQLFKEISKGRSFDSIERFIREAQDLDLPQVMCQEFYYDLLKNYQSAKYQKLIHGDKYTVGGIEIEFPGLKAVLSYFTYSRYVMDSNISDTPFGMVQKTNEFSQPISSTEKRDRRDKSISDAHTYWQRVVDYLNAKKADFPVWEKCRGCSDVGVKRKFKTSTF